MGFKFKCSSATVRPASSVHDRNYLHQMVEVDAELEGTSVFEELFFTLFEMVSGDDLDHFLEGEGYVRKAKLTDTAT
jgi:hypothetical protein